MASTSDQHTITAPNYLPSAGEISEITGTSPILPAATAALGAAATTTVGTVNQPNTLGMFTLEASNSNTNANGEAIDLDDLFSDCYFGEFPVPPFSSAQPNQVVSNPSLIQTGLPVPIGIPANMAQTNMAQESMAQASMAQANMAQANMAQANMAQANMSQTNMAQANMAQANMAQANMAQANMVQANMVQANMAQANMSQSNMVQTNMVQASNIMAQKRKFEDTQTSAANNVTLKNDLYRELPSSLPSSLLSALSSGASNALTVKTNNPDNLLGTKKLTPQQKLERRERNREHAKRSRLRKKFLLESLQEQIYGLQSEIEKLKTIVREEVPNKAEDLLSKLDSYQKEKFTPLPMPSGFGPVKTLMEPDFRLMSSLSNSQQNFAISDPSLPDNPIVYCSQGFLDLTEYTLDQVLGRNCRFLQGPGTDQSAVDVIRKGVREGIDTSVCLLNYKADGTPFWNQFFVAALRDADNNVVNFVGVQCEVSKAVVESRLEEQSQSKV